MIQQPYIPIPDRWTKFPRDDFDFLVALAKYANRALGWLAWPSERTLAAWFNRSRQWVRDHLQTILDRYPDEVKAEQYQKRRAYRLVGLPSPEKLEW